MLANIGVIVFGSGFMNGTYYLVASRINRVYLYIYLFIYLCTFYKLCITVYILRNIVLFVEYYLIASRIKQSLLVSLHVYMHIMRYQFIS